MGQSRRVISWSLVLLGSEGTIQSHNLLKVRWHHTYTIVCTQPLCSRLRESKGKGVGK